VSILDQNVEEDPWEALRERIASFRPEVIGSPFGTSTRRSSAIRSFTIRRSPARSSGRSCAAETPLIVGPRFSMFPEQ